MTADPDAALRVWTVQYGNYDPPEVDSTWVTKEEAEAEADRLNDEPDSTGMWEVGWLTVKGAALAATASPGLTREDQLRELHDASPGLDVERLARAMSSLDPILDEWPAGPEAIAREYAALAADREGADCLADPSHRHHSHDDDPG